MFYVRCNTNTFVYTDGKEAGFDITLAIILLLAWILNFTNREK